MPIQPLVDIESLDLDQDVVPLEEIRSVLQQRGRFALVDGILHLDRENQLIVGYKDIRRDDWWAEDHIPGRPLFPGTLMIEASAQISTFDFFQHRPELKGKAFIGFTGINKTRFRAMVEPDCRLLIVCKIARIRQTMFTYRAQGVVDGRIVFESEISGMVL